MEIHLKYTGIEPETELKEYIHKRLKFLDKLASQIDSWQAGPNEAVHAWVEIGRVTRHHKKGLVWYAECELKMPGKKSFRAASTNYDLGVALDEVKDKTELILQKTKEKYRSQRRRGLK